MLSRSVSPYDRERGQATTEFAIILIPLLALVGGIIYFGIGLNYWLDMNRVANQGARWAAVNNWPPQCLVTDNPDPPYNAKQNVAGCAVNTTTCPQALGATSPYHTRARLQEVLRCQTRNPSSTVSICYPGVSLGSEERGDPVRVKITAPYKFWFVSSLHITLTATATSRLEQKPTLVTNEVASC
jgi:Flp pilus assembly protein TadG